MQLIVLFGVSVVLSILGCIYLSWFAQQETSEGDFSWHQVVPRGKQLLFAIAMLVGLMGVSVSLVLIYRENGALQNIRLLCLLMLLFLSANVDYRKEIIPNTLILIGLFLRVIFWVLELIQDPAYLWLSFKNELLACVVIGAFFLLCGLLVKGGVGMGDIKLILVMCLFQGFYGVISALFCSLFAAFVLAIVLLIAKKKTRRDSIPFAPSILLGTLASVVLTGM